MTDERGRALLMALIVLGIGCLLIPPFLSYISTNLFASQATEEGIKEYYSADAAIEYTLWRLKCEPGFAEGLTVDQPISDTVTVGNVTVPISLTKQSEESGRNLMDFILVLDRSGSMDDGGWDDWVGDYQPIGDAKLAAKAFVDILDPAYDQVGLVSYSTDATLDHQLTDDFEAVKTTIEAMSAGGYTNIGGAIEQATEEFGSPRAREDSIKIQILLSDGMANVYDDTFCGASGCQQANDYALSEAEAAAAQGITILSFSLGEDADRDLMQAIADATGGSESFAPSSSDLQYLFESIALWLTAPEYVIVATVGGTTIETRADVCQDGRVGIITWLIR